MIGLKAFTPLASPAVIPLEASSPIPKYSIPGVYSSLVISPVLEAQSSRRSPTRSTATHSLASDHSQPPSNLLSQETSALHLAPKSNYEDILGGPNISGLSYPEVLAENLTSKRTNHKTAEQGRRNRINNALNEIGALLPQSTTSLAESNGGQPVLGPKPSTNAKNLSRIDGNDISHAVSKARTVEKAADYIKSLQTELAEAKAKLKSTWQKPSQVGRASTVGRRHYQMYMWSRGGLRRYCPLQEV